MNRPTAVQTAGADPPNLSPRAVHEAGHAVSAYLFGYTLRHVDVAADPPQCAVRTPVGVTGPEVEQNFLKYLMAGRTAEVVMLGQWSGPGAYTDRSREIELLRASYPAEQREAMRRCLEREVGDMLRSAECRRAVSALATKLARAGRLDGVVATAIIAGAFRRDEG